MLRSGVRVAATAVPGSEDAVRALWQWECPRCGAAPGARCRNRSGKPRRDDQTHEVRLDAGPRAMAALAQLTTPTTPFRSYDWYGVEG